jgi:hypothetical protein
MVRLKNIYSRKLSYLVLRDNYLFKSVKILTNKYINILINEMYQHFTLKLDSMNDILY